MVEVQSSMDVLLGLSRAERISEVLPLVTAHPAVALAEPWHFEETVMGVPSGQEVKVTILAGPADTQLYTPEIADGRWFAPGVAGEIVLNNNWARVEGVAIGDTVTLLLEGEETTWTVVGFNQDKRAEETGVYLDLAVLDQALRRTDRTLSLQVRYVDQDPARQAALTQELVAFLEAHGIEVYSSLLIGTIKARIFELFGVLVTFLLAMSILIALVGGLGLMGMMSINVLERSKEIGVMRAVGAGTAAILQVFWGESMVVALTSFGLAVLASVPLARGLTVLVGLSFLDRPLDFAYAAAGIGWWLVVVAVIGTLASILPARAAARMSVRESLSYE
jgi:putative ABC transport system permease protein